MKFDALQDIWQSQEAGQKVTIDADMLLKEVQGNKKTFERDVFWRDVREVGVAFLMVPFFIRNGIKDGDWPWYVLALSVLFIGMFILVDRDKQKKKMPCYSDPLPTCIDTSLRQVNHQIWLLRNILWWYLLPCFAGCMLLFIYYVFKYNLSHIIEFVFLGVIVSACVAINVGIYCLNQMAVRKHLEPRQQELQKLMDSLSSVKR